MKGLLLTLCLLGTGLVGWFAFPSAPPELVQKPYLVLPEDVGEDVSAIFQAWAKAHGKSFASTQEEEIRLANFRASVRRIQTHNQAVPRPSYSLGLTAFADMTDEEFMEHFGLVRREEDCSATAGSERASLSMAGQLPEAIDWREKGGVSPVKNQGHCGSCWTFSTTGALEAHYLLKTKRLVSLSEQQLLDCAQNYDNHGCNGGLPSHAFQYIVENGGLETERFYPYEAVSDKACRVHKLLGGPRVRVRSVFNITQFDEHQLEVAVGSVGPVSVAFQVAGDFRLYASGVYSSRDCKNQPGDVNHAVLAVGYGVSPEGMKYWIIKNSWGTAWGDQGYFLMERGKNMCGVADCASFPVLE